jgi:hypothetical protein
MRVVMTSRTDGITIGELSKLTGVHIETIRYFERVKLLPKPPRTAGGRRTYGAAHVRVLAFIKQSRELGFRKSVRFIYLRTSCLRKKPNATPEIIMTSAIGIMASTDPSP